MFLYANAAALTSALSVLLEEAALQIIFYFPDFFFRFVKIILCFRIFRAIIFIRKEVRFILSIEYTFSYDKLWHRLIDLKLKKKDLQKRASLSSAVIAKMGRGESVNLETIAKICSALQCGIADIVEFVPNGGAHGA